MAREVVGARPDLVLLVGWAQPLGRNFWRNMRLPRMLITNSLRPQVFYLSDSTMEEFPNSKSPAADFYHSIYKEQLVSAVEINIYVLMEDDEGLPALPFECTLSFSQNTTESKFKRRLLNAQIDRVKLALEAIRNPVQ